MIGSNWFLGYSHTSLAKDKLIKDFQTRERIAAVLNVFLEYGVDAVMGPLSQHLEDSVCEAEQRSGKRIIRFYTPAFDLDPNAAAGDTARAAFDQCVALHATFCMPHQCVTDALLDSRAGVIRDLDHYTQMIQERGMIPGLSTHMPESIVYADAVGADVETYVQIYHDAFTKIVIARKTGDHSIKESLSNAGFTSTI